MREQVDQAAPGPRLGGRPITANDMHLLACAEQRYHYEHHHTRPVLDCLYCFPPNDADGGDTR